MNKTLRKCGLCGGELEIDKKDHKKDKLYICEACQVKYIAGLRLVLYLFTNIQPATEDDAEEEE